MTKFEGKYDMERESFIRIYFKNKTHTILEKADFIYDTHIKVSDELNKYDWDFNRIDVNIKDRELICSSLLKSFKKTIKRHTTIKSIDENYMDEFSSSATFSASKNYKTSFEFLYDIETEGLSKYNSILRIYKFELIPQMHEYVSAKRFVESLVQEVITLTVFTVFAVFIAKTDKLAWNYLVGFAFLVLAVFFIFKKW